MLYLGSIEIDYIRSKLCYIEEVGGRVAHALLQLSERWPCHVWLVGRMKFALLEANLCKGPGLLVYPILLFSLPLSGGTVDMTEILLTGILSLNSVKLYKGAILQRSYRKITTVL